MLWQEKEGTYVMCTSNFHGFQGAGGGGLLGPSGGIAWNMVFMSMPLPAVVVNDASAATNPALPAIVGSVLL